MKIDELIEKLLNFKDEGIKYVAIMSKDEDYYDCVDIASLCYDFGAFRGSTVLLIPEYF